MRLVEAPLGRLRTDVDGARRYRPVSFQFDTRPNMFNTEIQDTWDPEIQAQHRVNHGNIRMGLLQELGTVDGEAKIDNFIQLGAYPFSITTEFNPLLAQVRGAFAHGDFYPALVGACALGERIFNLLLLELRSDFTNHSATTRRIRTKQSFDHWESSTEVLESWGVLTSEAARRLRDLARLRHSSVHYNTSLNVTDRENALDAIHTVQFVIEDTFNPISGSRYIAGVPGEAYLKQNAEGSPLVRRFFIPRCVLVSPTHRLVIEETREAYEWTVFDDVEYPSSALDDSEFADARAEGSAAAYPEMRGQPAPTLHRLAEEE